MPLKFVCDGAKLKCSFGSDQATFGVMHPSKPVNTEDNPAGVMSDTALGLNIKAPFFGQCKSLANPTVASATAAANGKLQEMPCNPVICGTWVPPSHNVMIKGTPALLENAKCMCAYAGIIEVADPGQTSVQTGGAKGVNITVKDTCGFNAIKLFLDVDNTDPEKQDNFVTIHQKDESIESKPLYFLSNSKGKKIKIHTDRYVDKCNRPSLHSIIRWLDNIGGEPEDISTSTGAQDNEIKVEYYGLHMDTLFDAITDAVGETNPREFRSFKYFFLPTLRQGNDAYVEEIFNFSSCVHKKETKVIVYPEIKYTLELSKDGISLSVEYGDEKTKIGGIDGSKGGVGGFVGKLLGFLGVVQNFLDIEKVINKHIGKVDKGWIELKLVSPELKYLFSWEYDVSDNHEDIGALFKVACDANPLIGGQITVRLVDLVLMLGGKVKGAGPLVFVGVLCDLAAWGLELCRKQGSKGIFINVAFRLNLYYNLELSYSTIASNASAAALKGGLEASLIIEAGVQFKAEGVIFSVEVEASATAKATASIGGEFKFSTSSELEIFLGLKVQPFELKFVGKIEAGFRFAKWGPNKEKTYLVGWGKTKKEPFEFPLYKDKFKIFK